MMTKDEILKQIDKSEHVISRLASKLPGQYGLVNRTRDYHRGRVDAFREVLFGGCGKESNKPTPVVKAETIPSYKTLMPCQVCGRTLVFYKPGCDTLIRCPMCARHAIQPARLVKK